jgi:YD repeat-containing protein
VIGGTLATVTRPDASSYAYDFSTFHEDHVDVSYDGCGVPPQFVYAPDFVAQVTHPSGAQGTFTFNYRQHGRTYVPQNCWTDGPDSGDRYPPVFTSLSITRKQISGTGLPATLQWQWSYPALAWGYSSTCTPSCPTTKIIDVTRPDGSLIRETYGVRYGLNDGLMIAAEVRTGATSLRSTTIDYRFDPAGQLYIQRVGDPIRLYGDASIGVFKPGIGQTTTQQGATFAWTVNNSSGVYSFDRFARPLQTTSSSSLGFTAARTQSYFDQLQLWVLGQLATKVTNGVTERQVDYFASTALPQHEYFFGQKTRSMTYRADSTVETMTDNLSKVTTLASWKRGLPQSVTFDDAVTRSALVDDNGWVTSVTNEVGGTTSYGYDGLGRITSIVYPTDPNNTWASTSRTFARSTAPEYGAADGDLEADDFHRRLPQACVVRCALAADLGA